MQPTIGIDIGGTHTRVGLVLDGRIVHRFRIETPARYETLQKQISELVTELAETTQVGGVGLAVPGRIDPKTKVVTRCLNLPGLEGQSVDVDLANAVGLPVVQASDVGAAALGQFDALPDKPDRMLYLSLGTGVGGALVLDHTLHDLSTDGPAHFGHILVDTGPDAPPCTCGATGTLEACVRGPALTDPVQREKAGRRLALGILQLTHLFRPTVVMLGGGVLDHHPELLAEVLSEWGERPTSLVPDELEILGPQRSSDDAGVLGAAALVAKT